MAAKIMASDHPRDQKALGRKVSNFNEETWKENCRDIVKRGNLAKVTIIAIIIIVILHLALWLRYKMQ